MEFREFAFLLLEGLGYQRYQNLLLLFDMMESALEINSSCNGIWEMVDRNNIMSMHYAASWTIIAYACKSGSWFKRAG